MQSRHIVSFALALTFAGCAPDESSNTADLSGATFTTTADGSSVDANIYPSKDAVYLDGGPKGNTASLPAGDYYYQVTDPSGHTLLSSDDISCRRVTIDASGVITGESSCATGRHVTGTDVHGGITVQLMPYADTPNQGGEYKAWITPVANYNGKFIERYSKTDNFKVRSLTTPPPPPVDAGSPPPCDAAPPPPPPDACPAKLVF